MSTWLRLVSVIWLISMVNCFTLDCDFRRECCWRSAEGEGVWETRKSISTNEFRRTFLVGKKSTAPDGPYVMRVETGAQEGGSSFMSCPFCSTSPVIVRYRHWQSPTAQVSLCWQLVVGQEVQDEDQEECIQVSANDQSTLAQQTLFVPIGKQIQLYFLIENVASKTYGVILIDRISVEYSDCKANPSLSAVNLGAEHRAIVPIHRSSSSKLKTSKLKTHVPQIDSGNRKPKINKLTLRESALNEEVARQIRNLEHTVSQDKDLRVSSGSDKSTLLSRITSERKSQKNFSFPSSSSTPNARVVSRLTTAIKPQTHNNPPPPMKTVKHFHEPVNRAMLLESAQRVAPSLPSLPVRPPPARLLPPLSTRKASTSPALPPPPLLPTSLGKDFNPLHDLVGKEFSDFLDPSFVMKDEEEGDDPEAEEYFRQQKLKPQRQQRVQQTARQPTRSIPSSPPHRVIQSQRIITQPLPPPPPPIRPIPVTAASPLRPLFKHPNQCETPGGCLFERGLCSYTHATLDASQKFTLTKVGLSSFALANVKPSSMVVLEAPTNLREEHLIVLDVLEHSSDVSLRGCCQVVGQPQLYCPFSTPLDESVTMWQSARFTCPANTVKLVFMCENRGSSAGECGIDNLRLHLPSDILLWDPCQKDLLSQL